MDLKKMHILTLDKATLNFSLETDEPWSWDIVTFYLYIVGQNHC